MHHLPHRRPRLGHQLRANQPEPQHHLHLPLLTTPIPQCRIRRLENPPPHPALPHPIKQHEVPGGLRRLNGPPPAGDLEEHSPESVNVGAGGGLPRARELGCDVTERAHHARGAHVLAVLVQPREPEVPQSRVHLPVQQHVARLHVPVHHHLLPLLVQVHQPRRDPPQDPYPSLPIEHAPRLPCVKEPRIKAPVRHVLVHQEEVPPALAPPEQVHEVAVPEPAEARYLRDELFRALVRTARDLLYSNGFSRAWHDPLVDAPEASAADNPLVLEAIGGLVEVLVAEPVRALQLPSLQCFGEFRFATDINHHSDDQNHRQKCRYS
ncbi:hypothetical protein QJS04_geneDACA006028 [Acorus gramineus]|uniref:Uncharacterized protein n=1 Tax=Acorus gramineus TaxID=55184 RepID=A0AAV9B1U7_ACOGR|nr:hypothetical protein QJS04_geneDACA006028 [Acorus gramineus]